ncbi:MAG: TetR/AcrR family transcriptional regulator [Lachnobacterium sp.]|nr:TetR/AcrR family transcriptional regulator [Lachnobacterium sp.]
MQEIGRNIGIQKERSMGASPRTSDLLKECMADALLRAMKEKSFEKITVTEITEAAGVNRSTWFRNFESKDEALTFKLVLLWYQWAGEHGMRDCRRYTAENVEDFFAFNASIQPVLETIYHAEQLPCVYDAFCHVMSAKSETTPAQAYEARFYSYGLFGLLDEWIGRGFRETPQQLAEMLREMMPASTQQTLMIEIKTREAR